MAGITQAVTAIFSAVAGWFGFQSKQQDRYNAPDVIANKDAARDLKEKEQIQKDIEESNRKGQVTDKERREFSED